MKKIETRDKKPETRNQKLATGHWQLATAFTLIELIVVITIIAILISAISISWAKAQQKGRDARRKSDLKAVQQALDTFYETTGAYPINDSNGQIKCDSIIYTNSAIIWGNAFFCTQSSSGPNPGQVDTFLQPLPKDPVYQASTQRYYYQRTDAFHYTISALLENNKDPDIPPQSTLSCTLASGRNYCINNP